jgi:hypothetical protein
MTWFKVTTTGTVLEQWQAWYKMANGAKRRRTLLAGVVLGWFLQCTPGTIGAIGFGTILVCGAFLWHELVTVRPDRLQDYWRSKWGVPEFPKSDQDD